MRTRTIVRDAPSDLATSSQSRWFCLVMLVLVAMVPGLCGCGKKAPPVAPQAEPVPAVKNLEGRREGDRVVLTWRVPNGLTHQTATVEGYRVYRSKQPLSTQACSGCPLFFKRVGAVPLESQGAGDKPLVYTDTVERGYHYVYKVIAVSPAAVESGPSNLVDILY